MSNFKSYFFYLPYLINHNKEFPSGTLGSIKYGKKTVKWMFCFLITRAPARISIPVLKTGPRVSRGFLYVSYPPRIEL